MNIGKKELRHQKLKKANRKSKLPSDFDMFVIFEDVTSLFSRDSCAASEFTRNIFFAKSNNASGVHLLTVSSISGNSSAKFISLHFLQKKVFSKKGKINKKIKI